MKMLSRLIHENRTFLVFIALMFVFRSAVADWMVVPSGSMNPTLVEGDRIFVHKMAYGLRVPFTLIRLTDGESPARGDIVVFESPAADGKTLVKRLIGMPGDSVAMENERLFINGERADYAPLPADLGREMVEAWRRAPHAFAEEKIGTLKHPIMLLPEHSAMRSFAPIEIPPDEYLMLGDNRDASGDSRYIGLVSRRLLLGRATRVVVSLNSENFWLPRGDRTLAPLQ